MKQRTFFTVIGVALWLIFILGCAQKRVEVAPPPSSSRIWQEVRRNTGSLLTFKGKAEALVETGFRRIPVNLDIFYRHPDWLTLRAYAPIGMKLVEMSFQKQKFIVYSPFTNEYVTGILDSVNIGKRFKLPVPDFDLRRIWEDLYHPVAQNQEPTRITNSGKYYVLSYPQAKGFREIWIHRKKMLIYRENQLDSTGAIMQYLSFSNYKARAGARFPRLIEIGDLNLGVKLTIETDRFEINPDIKETDLMISVPPEVKRIEIGGGRED